MNTDRLLTNLEKRISASVGHRADLQFADARKINKSTAYFLLAFTGTVPTSEDLGQFFIRKFNAKITPFLSTAKVYNGEKLVTVVGQILNVTRDYEDIGRSTMRPVITGAVYLDVPLQEVWEVKERAGQKVLVRKVKDDIMSMVSARKEAMMDSRPTSTFAKLAEGTLMRYLSMIDKGDRVKVLIDDKVTEADVVSCSDVETKVKTSSGVVTVPRSSVLEVVKKNPEKEAKQTEMLTDFYTKAYGDPKFAKDLVS